VKIFNDFIRFIKKPELSTPVSLKFGQIIVLIIKSLLLYFIFIVISVVFFIPLSLFDLIPDLPKRQLSDSLWIIGIGPVIEEMIFRFPLKNFFKNIFISIAILFFVFVKKYIGIPLTTLIALLIASLPYIVTFRNEGERIINSLVKNNYPYFFYFITLFFGFLHLSNLNNLTTSHYIVSPVIVLYQIQLGLYLGFLRVKYKAGIFYSIFVHAIFNSVPIVIKLI